MVTIPEPILQIVRAKLETYEEELDESLYSRESKARHKEHARKFVRWLGGEYSPADYDGSLS